MNKNHTQSDSISPNALRLLVRLSGIRQRVLAERFGISEEYLSKILNDKRKAKVMSVRIYNYILQVNSVTGKIAA
jgi:transcriptional regulator with XRE-family HTH domain